MNNVTLEELSHKAHELAVEGLGLDDVVEQLKEYVGNRSFEEPFLEDKIPEIATKEIDAEFEKLAVDIEPEAAHQATSEPIASDNLLTEPFALPSKLEPFRERATFNEQSKQWNIDGKAVTIPDLNNQTSSLSHHGKIVAGLVQPRPKKTEAERTAKQERNIENEPWWTFFDSVEQIGTDGPKEMLIDNFLNPGITFICGPIKEGKTLLCLEIAAALSKGRALFDSPKFKVNRPIPVLYLQTDMGSDLFKQWALNFRIPNDKRKFLARTRDKVRVDMTHPEIISAVRSLKPVVIIDSIYRYIDGQENTEDYLKIVEAIDELIREGACAVIAVVHSTKSFREKPTKENAARGSSILGAAADTIIGLLQDARLFKNNSGPNEVEVFCWGRYIPDKLRFAVTKRRDKTLPATVLTYKPNLQSYIDEQHHLHLLDQDEIAESKTRSSKRITITDLEALIADDPTISIREMANLLDGRISYKQAQRFLADNGWAKERGQGDAEWSRPHEPVAAD